MKKFFNFSIAKSLQHAGVLVNPNSEAALESLRVWDSVYTTVTLGFGFKWELDELTKYWLHVIELFLPFVFAQHASLSLTKDVAYKSTRLSFEMNKTKS